MILQGGSTSEDREVKVTNRISVSWPPAYLEVLVGSAIERSHDQGIDL
jgi:hypothetical protein